MKKFFILAVIATMCVSCSNRELNEVCNKYEEVSSAKEEKKKDPNFLIFKDRTQTGKEESR